MLQISGLSKSFRTDRGQPIDALSGVDLDVHHGEFVSLIGPSGCGKSTLLSCAAGLVTDFSGDIVLNGQRLRGPHPAIGMVFQEESCLPWLTALSNTAFPLEMRGHDRRQARELARGALEMVGLADVADRYPDELSGGMKQRVAIARALVAEPEVLLMDEPFGALDEQTRTLLGEGLLAIRDRLKQTILFVTHSIQEAVQLSDRVVVMTARPARIKRVVAIDLPRPRDSSILASPHFAELAGSIWESLREESLRTFREARPLARNR
ncbi:MAG: ABC transporter ATP-binding protein [Chloroflexota bacterium]